MATKPQRTRQLLFAMGTVAALSLSALVRDATAAIPASERQALIDLYNATGGASWTTRTNWRNAGNTDFSVSGTECTWYGVFCDSGGTKVQQLVLPLNHLVGTLPASLGSLTNLESLDMFSNQLTGSIPDLSNLATNLTALYLYSNQLSGSIPTSLGNLTNLTVLDLSSNQLTGAIPTALAYLTSLTFLDLSSNQLTGSITASLGSVTTLQRLLLKGNMLSGAIPTTLEYLTNLTAGDLDLRYNALYSTNATLTTFLNTAQSGGNWQSTQTVAPTGVATGTATSTSVALSWTPITYTADSGGYQVSYATVSGGPYTLSGTTADKTATGFTVTGLAAGTVYYFVVESVTYPNANNQNTVTSAPSAEVSATTSAGSCTAPSITSQPLGQSIQSGQTATVTVTASGTAPLSYQWYQGTSGDTSHLVGTNSSSFTTPLLTSTTSYWVRVSNSCGYVDSATAMVIVGVTYANFVWVPVASYAAASTTASGGATSVFSTSTRCRPTCRSRSTAPAAP